MNGGYARPDNAASRGGRDAQRPRDAHRDAAVGMAVGRVRHRTTQRELATPSRGIVYKERGGAGGWREEERRDDEERC